MYKVNGPQELDACLGAMRKKPAGGQAGSARFVRVPNQLCHQGLSIRQDRNANCLILPWEKKNRLPLGSLFCGTSLFRESRYLLQKL